MTSRFGAPACAALALAGLALSCAAASPPPAAERPPAVAGQFYDSGREPFMKKRAKYLIYR